MTHIPLHPQIRTKHLFNHVFYFYAKLQNLVIYSIVSPNSDNYAEVDMKDDDDTDTDKDATSTPESAFSPGPE